MRVGAGGAKGGGRGESDPATRVPDSEPGRRVTGAGAHTAARRNRKEKFTALLHHINDDCLETAFLESKKDRPIDRGSAKHAEESHRSIRAGRIAPIASSRVSSAGRFWCKSLRPLPHGFGFPSGTFGFPPIWISFRRTWKSFHLACKSFLTAHRSSEKAEALQKRSFWGTRGQIPGHAVAR
jgi:hypothetical protein